MGKPNIWWVFDPKPDMKAFEREDIMKLFGPNAFDEGVDLKCNFKPEREYISRHFRQQRPYQLIIVSKVDERLQTRHTITAYR